MTSSSIVLATKPSRSSIMYGMAKLDVDMINTGFSQKGLKFLVVVTKRNDFCQERAQKMSPVHGGGGGGANL